MALSTDAREELATLLYSSWGQCLPIHSGHHQPTLRHPGA